MPCATALSFTAFFDGGCLIWWGWAWLSGMEENKKSGGGDVRASPFRGTVSGIKPENSFSALSRSRPRWHALRATHIPRRPKKKSLREKKVGFAEKKLCLTQKWRIVCIKGGMFLPVITCHNRPSEAHCSGLRCLQAASFACMEFVVK